jgi:hypothetical protein
MYTGMQDLDTSLGEDFSKINKYIGDYQESTVEVCEVCMCIPDSNN